MQTGLEMHNCILAAGIAACDFAQQKPWILFGDCAILADDCTVPHSVGCYDRAPPQFGLPWALGVLLTT